MRLLFEWVQISKHVACFRILANGNTFEFEATDCVDSLGEFAKGIVSILETGSEMRVLFENEPGQHIVEISPSGDGRAELRLFWEESPYRVFGQREPTKRLYAEKFSLAEIVQATIFLSSKMQERLESGRFKGNAYRFPTSDLDKLKNA